MEKCLAATVHCSFTTYSCNINVVVFVSFQYELELVQGYGVPSEDIIYSGVCKQLSQIKYAAKNGIDFLVCDNEAELRKIARCHPRAK